MVRLSFTDRALSDLDAIFLYIARDGVDRADAVIERILKTIDILRGMPGAGRLRGEFGSGIRSLPAPPFVVFYRALGDETQVQVLRVIDGRRDLGTIFFG